MASFGRLRVAFRGAMAFSFHCFMCSGMPLTARDTTALFSAYCSYCKSYAMGMWSLRGGSVRGMQAYQVCFWGIVEGDEACLSKLWDTPPKIPFSSVVVSAELMGDSAEIALLFLYAVVSPDS